jgi:Domain of unknown function (DUF4386)
MPSKLIGIAAILLAIAFNLPFALLAQRFDYPDILRRPAAEVLAAFAAGGPGLVAIWYGFALSAVALIPFAIALAFERAGWQHRPALAIGGAITGALAGFSQAVGLVRWVFAVPVLAEMHSNPAGTEAQRAAAEMGFALLNQWGGVGIGEHLGQILTVIWLGLVALSRRQTAGMRQRAETVLALLAVAGIGVGLAEGPAMALGVALPGIGMVTVAGYLAFSLWLIVLGLGLLWPGANGRLQMA